MTVRSHGDPSGFGGEAQAFRQAVDKIDGRRPAQTFVELAAWNFESKSVFSNGTDAHATHEHQEKDTRLKTMRV
jgi:hypothetical protein